jgi:hypothetical protein
MIQTPTRVLTDWCSQARPPRSIAWLTLINSANNFNNPDPAKPVYWGDQTWEEMMIGWMDFAFERKQ